VLEEIKMYDDSPGEVVHDRFGRTLWSGANLGDPTIGYAHTVSGIGRDDLLAWRATRYAPATVFLTAAGNLVMMRWSRSPATPSDRSVVRHMRRCPSSRASRRRST